ncbi:hypothetical protein B2A_12302, partial [mine drainage metagenome]
KIALFQNLDNPRYREIVFGSESHDVMIPVFSQYRRRNKKPRMTRSRMIKLVELETKMLLSGTLQDMMNKAYASGKNVSGNIVPSGA